MLSHWKHLLTPKYLINLLHRIEKLLAKFFNSTLIRLNAIVTLLFDLAVVPFEKKKKINF